MTINIQTLEQARFNMIEQQIRPWDVLDPRVLKVMSETPRDEFVAENDRSLAYMDLELPIGHGETMLSPKVEGRVLQALQLEPEDSVLEIGTGTGFLTACLAKLAAKVTSVDYYEDFTLSATGHLNALGLTNVHLVTGDAAHGWSDDSAGYDAIVVSGSLPEYDECFEQELKVGGRLFIVVGERPVMEAMLVRRVGENSFFRETLFETELKPLIGREKKPEFVL